MTFLRRILRKLNCLDGELLENFERHCKTEEKKTELKVTTSVTLTLQQVASHRCSDMPCDACTPVIRRFHKLKEPQEKARGLFDNSRSDPVDGSEETLHDAGTYLSQSDSPSSAFPGQITQEPVRTPEFNGRSYPWHQQSSLVVQNPSRSDTSLCVSPEQAILNLLEKRWGKQKKLTWTPTTSSTALGVVSGTTGRSTLSFQYNPVDFETLGYGSIGPSTRLPRQITA